MSFEIAAMRNRTFLCAAIIVNAVAVILADSARIKWDLWDIGEELLVLLVVVHLRVAEPDQRDLRLIKGVLFAVGMMLVVIYTVG